MAPQRWRCQAKALRGICNARARDVAQTKHWAERCLGQCFEREFLGRLFDAQDRFEVGSLFASGIDQLGTAPMAIPSLYEGFKVPRYMFEYQKVC